MQKEHPTRLNAFGSGGRKAQDLVPPVNLVFGGSFNQQWPWVEIINNVAGTDGRVVDALVSAGVQGIVVAGTGNATVHESLQASLDKASKVGVQVSYSTRCTHGEGLSPAKIRIDLLLQLL